MRWPARRAEVHGPRPAGVGRRASGTSRERKGRPGRWAGIAVLVLSLAYAGVLFSSQPRVDGDEINYTTFLELAESGRLQNATILDVDSYVTGEYLRTDGASVRYSTPFLKESRDRLLDLMVRARVPITIDQQNGKRLVSLASLLLPALILAVLFLYLIVSYQQGTGLFAVRSGARRVRREDRRVTFADVAGQDAAVAELKEVTAFLTDRDRFTGLGAAVPKGVLLYGPPGCGKTLLARAVAGEASAAFFSIAGSDFVELYAGVGAARVRDLFQQVREAAPAIVFVDELDAIGRAREAQGPITLAREQDQALNQLLTEMDGFSARDGIIVLAATNRPDVLDPALLRSGRFDRTIGLERPGEAARRQILELHARAKPMEPGVDVGRLAKLAIGLSGADLAGVLNQAALLAARAGKSSIGQADLEDAVTRLLAAPDRQRRLSLRETGIGRRFTGEERITFSDVAGVDDAIEELADVRDYLAEPERFRAVGARTPRGILLSGPPGCGKTLLARAVAGEANAAFFSVAATEFATPYTGSGAARIRDLFAEARSSAPAIIFVDEIDAVGGQRSALSTAVASERDNTLNQLLTELDGFEPASGVLVMAATNRPDLLDPALVRPGRFDRHVAVALPDRAGRRAILELHGRDKPLAPEVDLAAVAALTQGMSGADLANLLNEAALLTARRRLPAITPAVLDEAFERGALGIASRTTVLDDEERRLVAFHEAGHALVALKLRGPDSLHKLSIAPRGGTLGRCTLVDAYDRVVQSRSRLEEQLAIGLGGWAAELLVFGQAASGSASDLRRVGELARRMVRDLGMSDAAGPLAYPSAVDGPGEWAPSEESRRMVDVEARQLAEEASARAKAILSAARPQLERVAVALLERESLSVGELVQIIGATPLARREKQGATPEEGGIAGLIRGEGGPLG